MGPAAHREEHMAAMMFQCSLCCHPDIRYRTGAASICSEDFIPGPESVAEGGTASGHRAKEYPSSLSIPSLIQHESSDLFQSSTDRIFVDCGGRDGDDHGFTRSKDREAQFDAWFVSGQECIQVGSTLNIPASHVQDDITPKDSCLLCGATLDDRQYLGCDPA